MTTPVETVLRGQASTRGWAWGRALVLGEGQFVVSPGSIEPALVEAETERFHTARELARLDLEGLVSVANQVGGRDVADIVHTQIEILADPDLSKEVVRLISEDFSTVGHAVERVFSDYIGRIEETGNTHMIERVSDLKDIRDRLQRHLNRGMGRVRADGSILVASEITPTELLEYAEGIGGIVMAKGGATSHVAIIASSLGIPVIMGVRDLSRLVHSGDLLLVDGDHCEAVLHPTRSTLSLVAARKADGDGTDVAQVHGPLVTACGQTVTLRANVELEQELLQMPKFAPEGIGLVRTESLVLLSGHAGRQQAYYEAMVAACGEHGVTIRLFDIGGDKIMERSASEDNPYLGWRGARVLLDRVALLDGQLEAILAVSGRHPGRIRVMVPMVTTIDEWRQFKARFRDVADRMRQGGTEVDADMPLGLMVEVPAVALRAAQFAREADFLSLGTNDLTQYMLAVDRGNPRVAGLFDGLHPSVLQAVATTAAAAMERGIPVSVCGELAGDVVSAACLLGLGVTELSMQMTSIPRVRAVVARHTMEEFRRAASEFLSADSADERRVLVQKWAAVFGGQN